MMHPSATAPKRNAPVGNADGATAAQTAQPTASPGTAARIAQPEPLPHTAYVYDGTTEGLFTAIFKAYENKEQPEDIARAGVLQPRLGQSLRFIETDSALAHRVAAGIRRASGTQGLHACIRASLSDDPDAGNVVYRFVHCAMSREKQRNRVKQARGNRSSSSIARQAASSTRNLGNQVCQDATSYHGILGELANPAVAPLLALEKSVMNERHLMQQFLRFEQLEGGAWFAQCSPKAAVVPLLMDWFCARFNTQPFAIYDDVHHMAGIYEGADWRIVRTDSVSLPEKTESEKAMRHAWQRFYDTVSIDARYHPELRVSFMPKRFWKHLPEMEDHVRPSEKRRIGQSDNEAISAPALP